MAKEQYILDIGHDYVTICHKGAIIREPSVAMVRQAKGKELIASGKQAVEYVGEIEAFVTFVRPFSGGTIVDAEILALMLEDILSKYIDRTLFVGIEIIVAIPCGMTKVDKEILEGVLGQIGFKFITFKENILAMKKYAEAKPVMVAILGASTTDVGVIDSNGIVYASTIDVGGRNIDRYIISCVNSEHSVRISDKTAEHIKINAGSLYPNNKSVALVRGHDIFMNQKKDIAVSGDTIAVAMTSVFDRISDLINTTLIETPAIATEGIAERGIYIFGGGAYTTGLQEYLLEKTGLIAKIDCDNQPELKVVTGLNAQLG